MIWRQCEKRGAWQLRSVAQSSSADAPAKPAQPDQHSGAQRQRRPRRRFRHDGLDLDLEVRCRSASKFADRPESKIRRRKVRGRGEVRRSEVDQIVSICPASPPPRKLNVHTGLPSLRTERRSRAKAPRRQCSSCSNRRPGSPPPSQRRLDAENTPVEGPALVRPGSRLPPPCTSTFPADPVPPSVPPLCTVAGPADRAVDQERASIESSFRRCKCSSPRASGSRRSRLVQAAAHAGQRRGKRHVLPARINAHLLIRRGAESGWSNRSC
jgi:hypothetical protein